MKLWLAVDPGETTGYSIWADGDLLYADQLPMWNFADAVYKWAASGAVPEELRSGFAGKFGCDEKLSAMVVEQWQLYPWELQNLAWDECRTARVIGALTLTARQFGVKFILQGADIKKGAVASGAEALFLEPVHENRHANDATMHGAYWLAVHHGKSPAA
jgi:hypothetical protein